MGCLLAEKRVYYGTTFFRLLGEGGLGRTPEEVSHLMTLLKRVRKVGDDAAFGLLKGYRQLAPRLSPHEIDRYVEEGLRVYARAHKTGVRFLEGSLQSSDTVIQSLSRERVLSDIAPRLSRLVKALTGRRIELGELSLLDADELIERGASTVALYQWLYLPEKIRRYPLKTDNERWYLLAAVVCAAMYEIGGFPTLHGHPGYRSCLQAVGADPIRVNLFFTIEYARALAHIREHWPGALGLVAWGLEEDYREMPPSSPAEELAALVLTGRPGPPSKAEKGAARSAALAEAIRGSVNFFDTARWTLALREEFPELAGGYLRPLSFMPDFLYTGESEEAPPDSLVADMKEESRRPRDERGEAREKEAARRQSRKQGRKEDSEREVIQGGYVYDEWSQPDHDYLPNHCIVHQIDMEPSPGRDLPADLLEQARRTRRIFEWLKPEAVSKEKYLEQGDMIDPDRLLDFVVNSRREPSPPVRFYQKPRVRERDLGTLILIDVSGSTGEDHNRKPIIEIEKGSALILGQGLSSLGDRFSICGFSGQGRENCEFFVYKGFEDGWNESTIGRLMGAVPRSSTRIGPALRHAGTLLSREGTRQKLLLLVTDGRPMDAGYDPESRYAQFDVRMACEENRRRGIHTFAITTEKNSRADMELMFPSRRFAILATIEELPTVLPRLYMRVTT
jgi:nitric oxide reductase activation protein